MWFSKFFWIVWFVGVIKNIEDTIFCQEMHITKKNKALKDCHQGISEAWKAEKQSSEAHQNSENLSWNDFMTNTTFHGVKYIFDPTTRKIRRWKVIFAVTHTLQYCSVKRSWSDKYFHVWKVVSQKILFYWNCWPCILSKKTWNEFHCRCAWFLAVSLAVLTFVAQVGNRMTVFFKYRTNVDVKINYVDKIEFPAVTVCNQNNYR